MQLHCIMPVARKSRDSSLHSCHSLRMTIQTGALGLASNKVGALPVINHFLERLQVDKLLRQHVPQTDRRCKLEPAVGHGHSTSQPSRIPRAALQPLRMEQPLRTVNARVAPRASVASSTTTG